MSLLVVTPDPLPTLLPLFTPRLRLVIALNFHCRLRTLPRVVWLALS